MPTAATLDEAVARRLTETTERISAKVRWASGRLSEGRVDQESRQGGGRDGARAAARRRGETTDRISAKARWASGRLSEVRVDQESRQGRGRDRSRAASCV